MSRQFESAKDVHALASQLIGLHAARASGPYVTAHCRLPAARTHDFQIEHRAMETDLVTLRCMRGTLHSVLLKEVPEISTAFREQRQAAARALLRRAGIPDRDAQTLSQQALETLAEIEPATPPEWVRGLSNRRVRWQRLTRTQRSCVLKALWNAGLVLAVNSTTAVHRTGPTFIVAPSVMVGSEAECRDALARRYFRTYGPASAGDFAWWTGWGKARTRDSLTRLAPELCEVRVVGHDDVLLMFEEDLADFTDAVPIEPNDVRLLAYEDPSVKAYFETRWRYLGGLPAASLFWYAGEALASAWVGGTLAVTWRWNRIEGLISSQQVRPLSTAQKALLAREFDELADRLRAEPAMVKRRNAAFAAVASARVR